MNCAAVRDLLMDVLYGEEHDPRKCFAFFAHIQECRSCEAEYMELVDTRSRLSEWTVADPPKSAIGSGTAFRGASNVRRLKIVPHGVWQWTQRAAAAILMLLGAAALFDYAGVHLQGKPVEVSQAQLQALANDLLEEKLRDERARMDRNFLSAFEWLQDEHQARMKAEVDDLRLNMRQIQYLIEEAEREPAEPRRVRGK